MKLRFLAVLALLAIPLVHAASDKDLGLHSDGGSWKFYPAPAGDASLPRVLLIGDSIMNGYRGAVVGKLKGKYRVDCWLTPLHLASPELHHDLRKVLAQGPYEAIHFNLGLHGWTPGRIPEGQYEPLLKKYVEILKAEAPDARLIWGSTTPMTAKGRPAELEPDHNPTITRRNAIALRVMESEGVQVNDLYAAVVEKRAAWARGDRFHWKGPAYALMAQRMVAALLQPAPVAPGLQLHVDPDGDDANPGSEEKPLATIAAARDAARGREGATIYLHDGTYLPDQPLVLTPRDSGLTIRAHGDAKPFISGARAIEGWTQLNEAAPGLPEVAAGKVWVAEVPKGWRFHYLYVENQSPRRAQLHDTHWRNWPQDISYGKPNADGQLVTFKNKALLEHLPSNGDVEMTCIMTQYGTMGNGVLTHIDPGAGTAEWNSTQIHIGFRTRRKNYTLSNALPFLNQPGEWCVDSAAGKVYYWPEEGGMEGRKAIAPKLYELIRLQGDADQEQWVEDVTLDGLKLAYTDRLPEDQWPDSWLRRQWEHVDAMLYLQGAKDCTLSNNRLLYSGSSGITLDQYCQGIRIEGNEIGWTGSDGVFLCGYGPGTLDVNRDNTLVRNWIHDMGLGNYWHSACIQIYQSGHNRIALNLLQNSAYTPVSLVGAHPKYMSMPHYFFEDDPGNANVQFREWCMFRIRGQDFPQEIQDGVRNGTYKFDRTSIKPYLHSRNNLVERNIVVEPEQLLDEGGAIYAWCTGKGNIWRENLIFKSSGMPGSSVLALDDLAEYFTVVGNVIWVNGRAACGSIGVRPHERGNVIKDNIRAVHKAEHADRRSGNVSGLHKGFYRADTTRAPVYALQDSILAEVNKAGGWPGNPDTGIPRPDESIEDAVQRALPEGSHVTIEINEDHVVARINFQGPGGKSPEGWRVDEGAAFGDRGGGLQYGWTRDNRDAARDRGKIKDPLRDGLLHFHAKVFWELALPNGRYRVLVCSGDSEYPSEKAVLEIEGLRVLDRTPIAARAFETPRIEVEVKDGRLTLGSDDSPHGPGLTRINYLVVERIPASPEEAAE